jgi:DNA-binding NtrC family response regulator
MKPTILITDKDLGFVFWLGQALDAAGYQAFPARGVADATVLIDEWKLTVDVLVINAALEGVPEFIDKLRQSRPALKVISILPENGNQPARLPGAFAEQRKPASATDDARTEWLRTIQGALPGQTYIALMAG